MGSIPRPVHPALELRLHSQYFLNHATQQHHRSEKECWPRLARQYTRYPSSIVWFANDGDLFTPRQLVALNTFSDRVGEARERVRHDAVEAGLPDDGMPLKELSIPELKIDPIEGTPPDNVRRDELGRKDALQERK